MTLKPRVLTIEGSPLDIEWALDALKDTNRPIGS
jgi:hypothetical protein